MTGELKAWAEQVHAVLLSFYGEHATADQRDHVASMTRAIVDEASPVAAGWRPPLGMEPWRVEARINEQRAASLGLCETVAEVYPDGEEETCGELREYGSVHCAEHQPAPLPVDETEWEWGARSKDTGGVFLETEAGVRANVETHPDLFEAVRRRVSPWEVTQ